ncbi:MAG: glycosyltransferase family 4 protein [Bacteroidales bacterium]|jgi:1,2-diacylglycerol-3-alpha-glucose alpha-1,2-galactosyltransferase
MKIHLVYEIEKMRANGVNTVFVQMVDLLKKRSDIEVVINGKGRGDVYHAHSYGLLYFLWGLGYKGRRILTVHVIPDSAKGSIPGWQLMMPFIRWYFRQVYSYADVCIALSPTVERAIRRLHSKTRIVRMYNPIPIAFWHRTSEIREKGRERLGLNEKDFVVLGVGQLEGRKGVEDFLDIAAEIPEAKFVWVGGRPFGALTEGLIRINHRIASAAPHISFPGMFELSDMPMIYAAADAFIFPSFQENCPMAPLEAAASGIPVVFRDLPEYRLLYEHPYQKASTTGEFIERIRKLMNDKSFYREGTAISKQLLDQFDEDRILAKLIGIYTELYRKSGSGYANI